MNGGDGTGQGIIVSGIGGGGAGIFGNYHLVSGCAAIILIGSCKSLSAARIDRNCGRICSAYNIAV